MPDLGASIYLKALPFVSAYYGDRRFFVFEGTGEEISRRIERYLYKVIT